MNEKLQEGEEDYDTLLILASSVHKRGKKANEGVFESREEEGCFKYCCEDD